MDDLQKQLAELDLRADAFDGLVEVLTALHRFSRDDVALVDSIGDVTLSAKLTELFAVIDDVLREARRVDATLTEQMRRLEAAAFKIHRNNGEPMEAPHG